MTSKKNQTIARQQVWNQGKTQTQTTSISNCLQALVDCTRQAIKTVSREKTEDLLLVLEQRQALIEQLQLYGDQLKSLSASDLAQRARLYELDAEMTAKANALQEKQRQGLMSVKREKLVSSYGRQQPKTIQALDRCD